MRFPITLTLMAASALAADPNGEEIIKKSMEAQGGEKLKSVKTVQFTGKAFIGGKIEAPTVLRAKRPLKYRTEIEIQGRPTVEAFDGQVKWVSKEGVPEKFTDEGAKSALDSADPIGSPLFNYREKGNTVEFLGKESNEGQACYKFSAKMKSGNVATVFVDQKSYLTFKIITKAGGLEAESKLNDYRNVSGILLPFSNSVKINGQDVMQFKYEKIELNVPMDDSLFTLRAKK